MAKKKPLTITRKQLEQIKNEITWDVMVLFIATCMDEFGWTEDDVENFAVRLDRYASAVNEHLISINKVRKIVENTIGVRIK